MPTTQPKKFEARCAVHAARLCRMHPTCSLTPHSCTFRVPKPGVNEKAKGNHTSKLSRDQTIALQGTRAHTTSEVGGQ